MKRFLTFSLMLIVSLLNSADALAQQPQDDDVLRLLQTLADAPGPRPDKSQEVLGGGPGIFLYNSSELPNNKFVALVKATASAASIPLQYEFVQGYGDDSAEIQKSNGGVPTVCLMVPVRYTHAHNGIMNRGDFDRTVDLTIALIQKLDAATVARVRDFTP